MRCLFVAWQDPGNHRWIPIGRLTSDETGFQFVYTRGALKAKDECDFRPLASFANLSEVYESDELFPFFSNRVPSHSRTDFRHFVDCLNIPQNEDDPIALLARSGGRRATDNLEVFPRPEPDQNGQYHIHFFAHGLRHLPTESIVRIDRLQRDEELLLVWDFQNSYDANALMLRTNGDSEGDRYFVGYYPRYLVEDAFKLWDECMPRVQVERINPPPAPLQLRLLCNMTACWPSSFQPFSSEPYRPIPSTIPTEPSSL